MLSKNVSQPRKTLFIYPEEDLEDLEEETVPDYPVNLFLTAEGYSKKITPQSLRVRGEHKLKEDDQIITHIETTNNTDLLFFAQSSTGVQNQFKPVCGYQSQRNGGLCTCKIKL